jgi:hypothetical protein
MDKGANPMNFYFISKNGKILPLIAKIKNDGCGVRYFMSNKDVGFTFTGLEIDPFPMPIKEDYVIFDEPGGGGMADRMRQAGFKVLGAGKINDDLEKDREYYLGIAERSGLKIPEKENLENEILVEGWFCEVFWVSGLTMSYRDHGIDLVSGLKAYVSKEVVLTINSMKQPLFRRVLWPLTGLLRSHRYIGPIGVRLSLVESDLYFNGFRACLNMDTIFRHLALMSVGPGKYFADFMDGKMKKFPLAKEIPAGAGTLEKLQEAGLVKPDRFPGKFA